MLRKIIFLIVITCSVCIFAQTLGASLDKKTLALGEVGTYKVHIVDLANKEVVAAPKNELLPFHFEEIKDSVSVTPNNYERIIQFQVFQEGKFTIPALEFKIGDQLYFTVPYEINVTNTAQKGDEINDIMNNKQIKLQLKDYWEMYKWYLLGVLLFLGIIWVIYYLIRYNKKHKNSPAAKTNKTLKDLDALKKKGYIASGNYRAFYVELIEIIRHFLTEQYQLPAEVLLTDDLINLLKNTQSISPENEKVLEDILKRGDLVKFAKIFPNTSTMEKDWQDTRDFVKRSSKDVELEKLTRKDV